MPSPTALKIFNPRRQHRLKMFTDVGDGAKKSSINHQNLIFWAKSYSKSFTHTGLICVKTLKQNISGLGPFKPWQGGCKKYILCILVRVFYKNFPTLAVLLSYMYFLLRIKPDDELRFSPCSHFKY
jgi:hypothetical protein